MYRILWACLIILSVSILVLAPATAGQSAAESGTWQCWGPELLDPCMNRLYDIGIVPETDGGEAWAVGGAGTILHWKDGLWRRIPSPVSKNFFAVQMASADDGWISGEKGTLLHWDGQVWEDRSIITNDYYFTLAFQPQTSQFWSAASYAGFGTIQQWTGSAWQTPSSAYRFGGTIKALAFVSEQSRWAVGDIPIVGGIILSWNGSKWVSVEIPKVGNLEDIAMLDASQGWAVGEEGALLRWDGTTWTVEEYKTEQDLFAVSFASPDDGWIVGEGGLMLHWDGLQWAETSLVISLDLYGIEMISGDEGWAVGDGGAILYWDGETWRTVAQPQFNSFQAISISPGSNGQDGWIVGSQQTMLRWDGTAWQSVEGPTRLYHTVVMLAPDDGWTEGYKSFGANRESSFYHWNGQQWEEVAHPGPNPVSAMAFLDPQNGWAVGKQGSIYHWDGQSWHSETSPTDQSLLSVAVASANNVWAVGAGGVLLHWDGAAWQNTESPTTGYLSAVGFSSPAMGWVIGSSQTYLRWDGVQWIPAEGPYVGIDALAVIDDRNAWAVGSSDIIHWNGQQWEGAPSPTTNYLRALSFASNQDGWAAGQNGVILRYGLQPVPEGNPIGIPSPTNIPSPTSIPSPTATATHLQPTDTLAPSITSTPTSGVTVTRAPQIQATSTNSPTQAKPSGSPVCAAPVVIGLCSLAFTFKGKRRSRL